MSAVKRPYLFITNTQTTAGADTDGKVLVKIYGEHGIIDSYIRLNNGHNNFELGDQDGFTPELEDVGAIYKIKVKVEGGSWCPAKIRVEHKPTNSTSVFKNPSELIIGTSSDATESNVEFIAENFVSIDFIDHDEGPQIKHNWMVFDYRSVAKDQVLSQEQTQSLSQTIVKETESHIETETGLRILNTSSVSAGGSIGPRASSSTEVEISSTLKTALTQKSLLQEESQVTSSISIDLTIPAGALLLLNFRVKTDYKKAKLTFFDGSEQEVVIPVFSGWNINDLLAKDRVEIRSDDQMTDEYKGIFQRCTGAAWTSKPYYQASTDQAA